MRLSRKNSTESTIEGPLDHSVEDEPLSPGEVRERAVAGAVIDVLQGMGVRIIGLVGTLVLARLLTPEEFGTVAFGMTLLVIATFLADGGIGSGLIRRADSPTRAELKALLGFQLGSSSALALAISAVLLPFGELGEVTALMVVALPLMAVRAPGVIMLERKLSYRPLAVVMIVESVVYYVWAVLLVLAGWGVWGLASASVVRALTGSLVLLFSHSAARLIPSFSLTLVRPLLGFGFRYQAVGVANMLRELGTNAAIAIVAGVAALGIWSVAFRILQIPLLFLGSLWRVSFPGMSQLVAAREDVGRTIERVVAVVAVASGLVLAPLVAATPAWVPALLGEKWSDAIAVIPPACLHLMVMGTISVALLGYLWAVGDASAVLRATLVGMPLMAAVMIPLLMIIGVPAVGFGWLASGVGEATVLIRSARKRAEFSISSRLIPPTVFAAAGATVGWFAALEVGPTIFGGLVGGLFAVAVYLLALWVWHRSHLLDTVHLSLRGMRQVLKSSA